MSEPRPRAQIRADYPVQQHFEAIDDDLDALVAKDAKTNRNRMMLITLVVTANVSLIAVIITAILSTR